MRNQNESLKFVQNLQKVKVSCGTKRKVHVTILKGQKEAREKGKAH